MKNILFKVSLAMLERFKFNICYTYSCYFDYYHMSYLVFNTNPLPISAYHSCLVHV